jgi:hypothetical protein
VSNKRPQIKITSNGDDLLQLVVPGVTRQALALAHAIVGAFLCDITDEQNVQIHAPKIAPGDDLLTCLVVTVELQRFGPTPFPSASVRRTKLAFLSKLLREAARRLCSPLYGGEPTHDVIEVA